MRKLLIVVAVLSFTVAQAQIVEPIEIKNSLGADSSLDYTLLKEMGPWDDRNYQLTKKDLSILPFDDQILANVPVFFKVQYRKEHPETGKYYPRSLLQNFQGNYGGLVVDGIWYKEGLGLGSLNTDNYGIVPVATQAKIAANEVAIESGVLGDESAIECNPVNKNNCVAGTNTSNGQTMYYSSDAGSTWTKSQTNPNSSCCDPTVDWSADGTRVYQGDLKRSGTAIGVRWSVSTDQGHTWGAMKNITTSGSDKEFIHVDRSPTSPYKDNIYMTWHDGNVLQFARSTDMGATFSTPISFTSEPQGIGSDITTDAAGNIYYFYPSTNSTSGIRMIKSTNGGASFSTGTRVAVLNDSFEIPIPSMETRHAFIYTSADVDRNNDTIYVAWTDSTNDSAAGNAASANHTWIRVAKSTNSGASWTSCTAPHSTTDSLAAGNAIDRYHPWIKVGNDSTIHIGYYDTRNSTNRTGVDFYYSTSTNACSSWTESRFSSQTSANLTDGQEWGDYNGLSVVMDKIAMTWTDNRSGKATFSGADTIATGGGGGNIAPVASFTQSCTGLSCSFNGSASSDSDGTIAGYSWSIGGTGVTASKTYASYGTYSVTLTVTDDQGATGSSTQSVVLVDPNASLLTNGVAKTGLSGATGNDKFYTMVVPAGATNLNFSLTLGSGDPDLYVKFGSDPTTASYDCRSWNGAGQNEICNITNVQAGTYHVLVHSYATYSGTSLTGSYTAPTTNAAPTAAFTSSCTDLSCNFDGSGSSDSDGSISSYSWSFGASGATASNTYGSAGTYAVTLTVTDNGGLTNAVTHNVTVTIPANVAPTASFTSSCTDLTCSFDGSGSSDSDGSITGYSWSFGGTGITASNTFASTGTYAVTLTVTDNNGATGSSTQNISVTAPPVNVAPTAAFTSSCTDLTCSFDGSGSSDSDGTISSYSWSFGATGTTASNTYGSAGTYAVTLTVTDNGGLTNAVTHNVTVTAPPTGGNVLTNGVAVTGLSASTGADVVYTMDVPAGATNIKFNLSGGTGDADMYVKFGSTPTDASYDCRPYVSGNTESCTGTSTGGTYYIRVKAYSAFSGVSLVGSFSATGTGGPTPIDTTTSNISVARNAWKHYTVNLSAGYSTLTVTMSGGSGDADLYVRQGAQSTTTNYDCRPYKNGNNEACTFNTPATGTWYIDIRGYSAASGVTLRTQAN